MVYKGVVPLSTNRDKDQFTLRVPTYISGRDILILFGFLVSLVTTWGSFQTKIVLIEQQNASIQRQLDDNKRDYKELQQQVQELRITVAQHRS